jgi:hypothetical protein
VKYILSTFSGNSTTTIDQSQNNFEWVSLGNFQVPDGCTVLTLDAANSDTTSSGTAVIADAVHFLKIGDPPPTPTPKPNPSAWLLD